MEEKKQRKGEREKVEENRGAGRRKTKRGTQ